jgi:hypothetical protein
VRLEGINADAERYRERRDTGQFDLHFHGSVSFLMKIALNCMLRRYAPVSYDLNHIALAPSNIQFVASDVVEM